MSTKTQSVAIEAVPATSGATTGALVLPEGDGPAPGIVLLQEYWGLNDHIRSVAERWAAEGFVVLAPDLYRGQLATTPQEALQYMGAMDRERALADIAGAVATLRSHPRCTGKLGLTGYCMGGAYSFAAATRISGLSAVVPFYGVPQKADWSKVEAPIQAHFASVDDWAKPELAEQIQRDVRAHGGSMELFVYEAEHAFCNDTREVYSPDNAQLAWARAVAFMRQNLQ
jgi:carboxymethylenebutenolidase